MSGYGLSMVQNIRKRIGQTVIYGESRYTKRNGLEGWMRIVRVETSESTASGNEREGVGGSRVGQQRMGLDG